jgi:hypothetical protein
MNQTILNKLNEIVESQAKRGLMTAFEFANLIKEDLFPLVETHYAKIISELPTTQFKAGYNSGFNAGVEKNLDDDDDDDDDDDSKSFWGW